MDTFLRVLSLVILVHGNTLYGGIQFTVAQSIRLCVIYGE